MKNQETANPRASLGNTKDITFGLIGPDERSARIKNQVGPNLNLWPNEIIELQPTNTVPINQQIALFSSIPSFDKEILKETTAKTLENLIRREGSTSTRHRQPFQRPKRLRRRTTSRTKIPC